MDFLALLSSFLVHRISQPSRRNDDWILQNKKGLILDFSCTLHKVMTRQNIIYYTCKAQTIDKLELPMPKMFHPDFKSYVHFIVCEKWNKLWKPNTMYSRLCCYCFRLEEQNTPTSQEAVKNFENGIKKELQVLRDIVEVNCVGKTRFLEVCFT